MTSKLINQQSNWPALDAALRALAQGEAVPPAVFAAIADRLRSAVEAPEGARIEQASTLLEHFFREAAAAMPAEVRAASRGAGDDVLSMSYGLGKLAFAQLFAARVADTRADSRFVEHLRDSRYLPYIQALYAAPRSVGALSGHVQKRIETVSRKLAVLRGLGIVASRKEGNVVVNMLTPAATALVEQFGLASQTGAVTTVKAGDVRQAIEDKHETLPRYMREVQPFVGRGPFNKAA
ncbi:MAG: hypothetical protein JWR80_7894 [Bradyrhizobium sp.]|nr:hypothetical protein [Bradyrhizobium sp.]